MVNCILQEAGLQNQGDIGGPTCPYLLRSSWEYADVDQPGWQWVYDYTANLVCNVLKQKVSFSESLHFGKKNLIVKYPYGNSLFSSYMHKIAKSIVCDFFMDIIVR